MGNRGVYLFEGIDEELPFMPLAARRVLDQLGRKLSLDGWLSLSVEDRRAIVRAGSDERAAADALAAIGRAAPPATATPALADPHETAPPPELSSALGAERPLDAARWRDLAALDRYALLKYVAKRDKLARAYDEIVGPRLTHLTRKGEAHMVDVGAKPETARRATAIACVRTTRSVIAAIADGSAPKGDVLGVARVAGVLAAKRTPELIPLCHPVRTTRAAIDFEPDPDRAELRIRATMEAVDRTGVEMEAMLAASVAALAVYDMIKSADRWATIDGVRLEAKSGGKSGEVVRPPERGGA